MAAVHNLVRVAACTRIAKMEGGDTFKSDAEESAMEIKSAVGSIIIVTSQTVTPSFSTPPRSSS